MILATEREGNLLKLKRAMPLPPGATIVAKVFMSMGLAGLSVTLVVIAALIADNLTISFACLLAALTLGCPRSESVGTVAPSRTELTPTDQALILRLEELHRQGKFEQGVAEAEAYLRLHPEVPQVHYALGTLRGSASDHQGAIAEFTNELERDPTHVESLMGLAIAYTRLGDLEASLGPLQKCVLRPRSGPTPRTSSAATSCSLRAPTKLASN